MIPKYFLISFLCCQLWLQVSETYTFRLSQPQIFVENGNLYIAPAEHRNLVLVSNGTGKILFNDVELKSLVSSIQNSSRDLNSFKRIFGVPSNSSSALTERISHLEQSFRQLDQIDRLDSRLIAVERQIAYNLSSSSEV
ncbi:unnamed protein product [Allacma fusca]|uniref:Uncharacterized protein n=1 Tax=Allacma fusca TaxID=39272 RepID=A0A8J2LUS6_9HEXA|nr:unnamed protein product [Allacma fusca]